MEITLSSKNKQGLTLLSAGLIALMFSIASTPVQAEKPVGEVCRDLKMKSLNEFSVGRGINSGGDYD